MRCVLIILLLMPFKDYRGLLTSRLPSEVYLLKTEISISLAPYDGMPP
jgi:hypothetical protein